MEPRIVIYYDVITDEEIKTVKDFASPRVSHRFHKEEGRLDGGVV